MRKKYGVGFLIIAVVALGVYAFVYSKPTAKTKAQEQLAFPKGYNVGMWNWTAPDKTSKAQNEQNAKRLKAQGITDVYVDLSSYIDYDESKAPDRQSKIDAFTAALKQQVSLLSAQGIKTQALIGNTKWSNPDYVYIPQKFMQYVAQYNAKAAPAEKLRGIQFDVEFYSDPTFTDDPTQATLDYLAFVKQMAALRTVQFAADPGFAMGFAVSDWLDGTNSDFVPNVSLDGGPKHTPYAHIVSLLKGVPQGYIAVMAYRNHADGPDGTIARARSEVTMAQASNVSVIVGEEAGKVDPAKLTFYGQTKNDLKRSTIDVQKAFAGNTVFKGFGINDQQSYFALKD